MVPHPLLKFGSDRSYWKSLRHGIISLYGGVNRAHNPLDGGIFALRYLHEVVRWKHLSHVVEKNR
jgi:hypothetical protein